MPATRTRRAWLLALTLTVLTGCTLVPPRGDATPDPTGTGTPSAVPAPEPPVTRTQLPEAPTTVLDAPDAVGRAIQTSGTFYAEAPIAVIAPADDAAAQLPAASLAVALGAPLLLADGAAPAPTAEADGASSDATGTDQGVVADAVRAELERLGTTVVVTVGDVPDVAPAAAEVVAAPRDAEGLEALIGQDVTVGEAPADPVPAVAALDRDAPTLLGADQPAATEPGDAATSTPEATVPADSGGSTEPTELAGTERTEPAAPSLSVPTPSGTEARSATPSGAPDERALPDVELPEPLTDAVLLALGEPADLAAVATARAAGVAVVLTPDADPRTTPAVVDALAAAGATATVAVGGTFGAADDLTWRVETAATGVHLPGGGQVLFPGRRMIALYGTPGTASLGLLGEQDLAESIARAQKLTRAYRPFADGVPVVPAFEMIVTIASAGAGDDGNYSQELPVERFVPWIEAAQEAGVYVVLDLQPGRTDFLTQAKQYESLLRYPNVGLALDPEWRLEADQVHLRQIGSVTAAEVNQVVTWLADLTRAERLPQKLLILHQFSLRMISDRAAVDTSRPELAVLIHADGQGSQPAKAGTWRALHQGAPSGVFWGWKNFLDEDSPMLTPEQTYAIRPRPEFVSYQ